MGRDVKERTITTDVLVIGSGIAGCFAAIHACRGGAAVTIVEPGRGRLCGPVRARPQRTACGPSRGRL